MEANEMGTLPVGRLLRKMSMPLIISMFVQVLYSLVDSLYVAQLGDNALTAISLPLPSGACPNHPFLSRNPRRSSLHRQISRYADCTCAASFKTSSNSIIFKIPPS